MKFKRLENMSVVMENGLLGQGNQGKVKEFDIGYFVRSLSIYLYII